MSQQSGPQSQNQDTNRNTTRAQPKGSVNTNSRAIDSDMDLSHSGDYADTEKDIGQRPEMNSNNSSRGQKPTKTTEQTNSPRQQKT